MAFGAPPIRIGRLAAGSGFRVLEIDYVSGWRQPAHAHETTGITLVVSGDFRETACGREEWASSLSVVVKPAGVVHADETGPRGARTILVEIGDPSLLPIDIGPWRWLHAGPGVRPLLALARALRGEPRRVEDSVHELIGEMTGDAPAPTVDPPAWVRRAREAIDDGDPLATRVRDLAGELDVHPVSLTRAFRRHFGVPVTTYRRRARLRRAATEVADGRRQLARVAHASGYADHAHMCREIRRATGCTPSELRAMAGR
jgi:AraC family transcriptional regulator